MWDSVLAIGLAWLFGFACGVALMVGMKNG
jgi:hypothetical protein